MVITKTPFRMSFFGGGTDFESFYTSHTGSVLSTTFDKYCYVTVRRLPRFFEYSSHITYSKNEFIHDVNQIEHPLVREAMKLCKMDYLRIIYDADLPARTGLGTSSSFAVGLLNAFYALQGNCANTDQLANDAIYLERVLCNEKGGIQDQIAASFGGFNRIDFSADGYTVKPVVFPDERKAQLNNNLMMFFTGFTRLSFEIQKNTEQAMVSKTAELKEMLKLVDEAETVLTSGSKLDDFGRLLDYTWQLKRGISAGISTNEIDILYKKAMQAGALGGKLLGAGGGGFLVFYVPEDQQPAGKAALHQLLYVPFLFEHSGTTIVHNSEHQAGEKIV